MAELREMIKNGNFNDEMAHWELTCSSSNPDACPTVIEDRGCFSGNRCLSFPYPQDSIRQTLSDRGYIGAISADGYLTMYAKSVQPAPTEITIRIYYFFSDHRDASFFIPDAWTRIEVPLDRSKAIEAIQFYITPNGASALIDSISLMGWPAFHQLTPLLDSQLPTSPSLPGQGEGKPVNQSDIHMLARLMESKLANIERRLVELTNAVEKPPTHHAKKKQFKVGQFKEEFETMK